MVAGRCFYPQLSPQKNISETMAPHKEVNDWRIQLHTSQLDSATASNHNFTFQVYLASNLKVRPVYASYSNSCILGNWKEPSAEEVC